MELLSEYRIIQNYTDKNRTENTIYIGVVSELKISRITNGIERSLTNKIVK